MLWLALLVLASIPVQGQTSIIKRYEDWRLWIDKDPMGLDKPEYFITSTAKMKTDRAKEIYESSGNKAVVQMTVECGNYVSIHVNGHMYAGLKSAHVRALWITGEAKEPYHIYAHSSDYSQSFLKLHRRKEKPAIVDLMRKWEEVLIEIRTRERKVYLPFSLRGFTKAYTAMSKKCKEGKA